ncbi:MAG: DNA polymerase III subunit alpha, partial [Bacteroidetes bacterium]|nr:DNA polymerase III subunit alpha [Bacteroidota bacterium]
MPDFAHLHVHTQYSLLDGATHIENLVSKAVEDEMKAVAITDHGNMFGVFKFVAEANKQNLKPVIGCEFYLSADMHDKKDRKRFHQVLLAKNEAGYRNLSKLCSLGFLEGMYYKPRIDKNLIKKHLEGIIATTCCLQGEVPRAILDLGEEKAESIFKEWLDIFGEDYYIELQRHDLADQNTINEVLIKWSKKYHVKMIATNDVHYLDQNDAEAHDLLLCIQTGKDLSDPNRMRFSNDQFFFKTKAEMTELFSDIPEALDNTMEVVSKVETLDLRRDILLPNYKLPQGFKSEDEYLKHISYEGAKLRYGSISDTVKDRLQYELEMVGKMGFAGYFLIVQDFVKAAEKMGVLVGPGRGSAAGSAVAYCTGITNIDPIKYNLLFERFLNPERVSMPDIDIDFDDEGRQKVIDYVVEQYGKEQVAPIITFGSMKARSAIRDVARVLNVPLHEADKMAKLVPEGPKINLAEAYKQSPELADIRRKGSELQKKTLKFAESLEGSVRHSGIH